MLLALTTVYLKKIKSKRLLPQVITDKQELLNCTENLLTFLLLRVRITLITCGVKKELTEIFFFS